MLADTHCHLDFPEFDSDRDAVIERARRAGVRCIVNVGTDISSILKAVELAEKHPENPGIFAAGGIHPCDTGRTRLEDLETLKSAAAGGKIRALGETGLDFHYTRETEKKQKEFFACHIELAESFNLPLIVHQRSAAKEIKDFLAGRRLPEKVVFHCFGGDAEFLDWCLKKGFWLSFTGILTFPKAAATVEAAKKAPLERLFLETDAPFLAPVPVRGRRNEPAYLKYTLEQLARIRGLDPERLAEIVFRNSCEFFNLPNTGFPTEAFGNDRR